MKTEKEFRKMAKKQFVPKKITKEGHTLGMIGNEHYVRSKNKKNYILGW